MPAAAPPRRTPREHVAASILDAAVSLFSTRGYEATTMQDVAQKVGMTAPALYYHFDSKQRLLFEVIERNLRRFNAEIVAATDAPALTTPDDRLQAFVRTHVAFQLHQSASARIYNAMFLGTSALIDALTTRQRSEILTLQGESLDRLKAIVDDGIRQGDFAVGDTTVAVRGIVAMGELAPTWYRSGGRLDATQVAEEYASLALKMVAPSATRRGARHRTPGARR